MFPAKTKLEFPGEVKAEEVEEEEVKASVGEVTTGSDDLEAMPEEEEEEEKEKGELPSEKSDEEQNVSAMEVE